MNISVPVYYREEGPWVRWITVGLGKQTIERRGQSSFQLQRLMVDALRTAVEKTPPENLAAFQMSLGIRLERRRLELTLYGNQKKRKFSGLFPLILEPRWFTHDQRVFAVYHPEDQQNWFPLLETELLEEQATLFFQKAWAGLSNGQLEKLRLFSSKAKDGLRILSFHATPPTLLDYLPEKKSDIWDDLRQDDPTTPRKKRGGYKILPQIGINLSPRAAGEVLPLGLPRSPYREQLQLLLCGQKKESTILVGPDGVGKTTLRNRLVWDLLCADGYEAHRNLDKVHDVWLISGKRMISGMSHVGDWERRCLELLEDAARRPVILVVEDIHLFGQLGRHRQSDRSFADFFRSPVARGDLVLVGECTPEQLQHLEDEAPSFASLFTIFPVAPATPAETLRMMMSEARQLEQKYFVEISPYALRTILEVGGALFPGRALPGKALEPLRQLVKEREGEPRKPLPVEPEHALLYLSQITGLPEILLRPEQALEDTLLEEELGRQVVGQKEAIRAAADLILRIKTGLVDPKRPYGVYLFTGPTGTGKTELAKAIATYLYGSASRLLRFDMGEYSGWDAPARLIGDRFQPEGLLTQQVKEQPFCVVLFDEIEKAHPSVLNLLLQLFDEGRLTDASGALVSFTSAVIIMTSNLGAKARATVGFGESAESLMQDIARAVREFFPPELFNRIDRIVPFWPISPTVAKRIVEKELGKLLGRQGLRERNIFVQVNDSVRERIVKEAFDARDGARSLKRYLEQHIGGLLSEEISRGYQGAVHLLRVYERNQKWHLYQESLRERAPIDAHFPLEPLLDLPLRRLKEHLPKALEFVQSLEKGETLQNLSEEIQHHLRQHNLGHREHDETLYNLDTMRQELADFRENMERLMRTEEDDHEMLEFSQQFRHLRIPLEPGYRGRVRRMRLFDFRAFEPDVGIFAREQILTALAEAYFLERALARVKDPNQHAVLIELTRIGDAAIPGRLRPAESGERFDLLRELAKIYAQRRGEMERFATLTKEKISEGTKFQALHEALSESPDFVVLKILGLGVYDFFQHETGCHLWQSLSEAPQVVRVRVSPAPPSLDLKTFVEEHRRARDDFARSLEEGREPPENPQGLLPAVRKIRFDPPPQTPPGATSWLELEDYAVGYSTRVKVRTLPEGLSPLWLLRMSRKEKEK